MSAAPRRAIDLCRLSLPFCARLACSSSLHPHQPPRSVAFRTMRMNAKRRPKR